LKTPCSPFHRVPQVFGLALFLLVALVPAAFSDEVTYQWTDADGLIHFTDDPGKIPESFRDSAQEIRHPDEPKKKPPSTAPESQSPPETQPKRPRVSPSEAVDSNGHNREWWQERVQEWQSIKADAQAKLADAQDRLGHARYLDSTPAQTQKIQEISAEISKYEKKIQEADDMLTDGLADEARKAHAPPGWLRE
jgi:Domain of unknown function (DUF4124)